MKLLWFSNAPWVSSGYGTQTALMLPRLAKELGHENVACAVTYGLQGGIQIRDGVKLYPMGLSSPYSDDIGPVHAAHFNADLVITLIDVWALQNPAWNDFNIASWTPVDHVPCPPAVAEYFERTGAMPIAMSRFGERALGEALIDLMPPSEVGYVPHAIDTTIFTRREEARSRLGWPESPFIVGMVAMNKTNPSRKAFAEAFMGFARFKDTHPDSKLYVQAHPTTDMGGLDLQRLVKMCGLEEDDVIFPDPYLLYMSASTHRMALTYSAMDVLLAPSMGEGFCIPLIEAQACGTPVICSDFTAQPELVFAGWTVPGQPFADTGQGAWFQTPDVFRISQALKACYERSSKQIGDDRMAAVAGAQNYDIELVWQDYWLPWLKDISTRDLTS